MPVKGSGQFGPDVIVGSPEYFRLLRKKNPGPQRLAQKRYLERQRKMALAAKLAVEDHIPIEQALEEVGTSLQNIAILRDKLEKDGRISRGGDGTESRVLTNEEMGITADEPTPAELEMVRIFAAQNHISFDDAFHITQTLPSQEWDEALAKCKKV